MPRKKQNIYHKNAKSMAKIRKRQARQIERLPRRTVGFVANATKVPVTTEDTKSSLAKKILASKSGKILTATGTILTIAGLGLGGHRQMRKKQTSVTSQTKQIQQKVKKIDQDEKQHIENVVTRTRKTYCNNRVSSADYYPNWGSFQSYNANTDEVIFYNEKNKKHKRISCNEFKNSPQVPEQSALKSRSYNKSKGKFQDKKQ